LVGEITVAGDFEGDKFIAGYSVVSHSKFAPTRSVTVNIYVGKLSVALTREELTEIFQKFGKVTSTRIIKGRYSGHPRRFAFVEMPNSNKSPLRW
jgi:RNA recognition motif-containing protein